MDTSDYNLPGGRRDPSLVLNFVQVCSFDFEPVVPNNSLSLRKLSSTGVTRDRSTKGNCPVSPYRTYSQRLNRKSNVPIAYTIEGDILESDPAIRHYYDALANKAANKGVLPKGAKKSMRTTLRTFAHFADLEVSNHAINDLIRFKQENPFDRTIEKTLEIFSEQKPTTSFHRRASSICGVFQETTHPYRYPYRRTTTLHQKTALKNYF